MRATHSFESGPHCQESRNFSTVLTHSLLSTLDLHQLGYRIICPYFLQLSRESWWNNSQGRREFQIVSLMLAARFGYKHDQWQNTDPLFWRAFLIRINKHHRTQTTKPQALTIHNIALKLPNFKLPNVGVLKSRFPKYRRAI